MEKKLTTGSLTPLEKQYLQVKNKYPDSILFFRLGDFYEMFGEDAKIASEILNITLTARNNVPMCGIPYHSSQNYISKLLNSGHKIAICEQLEKPSKSIKIVKRDVVRVISPGTIIEENLLSDKDNNYLVCIVPDMKNRGIALSVIDISTGDFSSTFIKNNVSSSLTMELAKYSPKEVIIPENFLNDKKLIAIVKNFEVSISTIKIADSVNLNPELTRDFKFGQDCDFVQTSVFGILNYIFCNYKEALNFIKPVRIYEVNNFLHISENSISHLELIQNFFTKSRKHSLLDVLNQTRTSMGARLLKKWLLEPLLEVAEIKKRQDFVELFYNNFDILQKLRQILGEINDIERTITRINCNANIPRDLIALKKTLSLLESIKNLLSDLDLKNTQIEEKICSCLELLSDEALNNLMFQIDAAIVDNPPNNLKDGNIIKPGFNDELDRLRNIRGVGKNILLTYETEEKERLKIPTLKIKFNNVVGYFFEITNLYKKNAPQEYIRLQTLSNCERFTTERLKKYEIDLQEADQAAIDLELKIYNSIREKIRQNLRSLQILVAILSELDVITNFAFISKTYNYSRPNVSENYDIVIKNGRHPVVERIFSEMSFVPNDTIFDRDKCRFYLITGPNMAGKSTYIRQVGLIIIMAQIGCFVPADEADVGVVDKIFSRIGSGDKLVKGESTFLVEMKETVEIIKNSTERSLVILDEVGRGTSTFDGISLAWTIAEELIERDWMNKMKNVAEKGPKTLFATHYLELAELENIYAGAKNFSLLVDDNHGDVVFLHKLAIGKSNKSYGIHVAKIAGLPGPIIDKAKQKLKELEKITKQEFRKNEDQFSFFENNSEILNEIKSLNLDDLAPTSALLKIQDWQKSICNSNN